MYEFASVFQHIIDAFYDVSFPQHGSVPQGHNSVLPVCLDSGYKMDAVIKQDFKEFRGDIFPFVVIPLNTLLA